MSRVREETVAVRLPLRCWREVLSAIEGASQYVAELNPLQRRRLADVARLLRAEAERSRGYRRLDDE
jgi:hypothetical protein